VRELYIEGGGFTDAAADLAVLATWGAVGLAVALRVLRWEPREA
jgi:hypothetical protein